MHQYQAGPAIDLCIRRVQRATCGRGIFQARRALLGSLHRAGTGPKVAQGVADAAVRLGQWLGGVHDCTVGADRQACPPTDGGVTAGCVPSSGEAARV